MTRSIDLYYDGPTLEKFLGGTKCVCITAAIAAVALSALDLANIHSVEAAVGFINDNRQRVADLPDRIRSGIDRMSVVPEPASVTIAIPRDEVATISQPASFQLASLPVKADISPLVNELAAARHLDAVEVAMASPPESSKSELRFVSEPAPVAVDPLAPMIFASADEGAVQDAAIAPTPVSLPMSSAIPLDMVPMPRAAPGLPPPSPAERLHLEGATRAKAERCLANAIYFEARSEPVRGQMAVAQVVVNRAFSGFYPNDICGVVYQNANRHLACQFTFACDGKRKLIDERGAWARANRIAKETLDGQIYVPEVAKSTHYHAVYVHPDWVREMKKMVRFGTHNFYRPIAWGNGAQEPVWGSPALMANKKD